MTDGDLLRQIWAEIRQSKNDAAEEFKYLRARLDKHIEDQSTADLKAVEDIGKIREDLREHKVKIGIILTSLSFFLSLVGAVVLNFHS